MKANLPKSRPPLQRKQLDSFSSHSKDASSPKFTTPRKKSTSHHTSKFKSFFTLYVVFKSLQAMSYGMIFINSRATYKTIPHSTASIVGSAELSFQKTIKISLFLSTCHKKADDTAPAAGRYAHSQDFFKPFQYTSFQVGLAGRPSQARRSPRVSRSRRAARLRQVRLWRQNLNPWDQCLNKDSDTQAESDSDS